MIYLQIKKTVEGVIKYDENSGNHTLIYFDETIKDKIVGVAFELDNGMFISDYNHKEGRVVQVGKRKWLLSDKAVKCTYKRFFSYEFFSIYKKGEEKFKICVKSQSPFLKAIFDPTYDELDKCMDYFFYNIWSNWNASCSRKQECGK